MTAPITDFHYGAVTPIAAYLMSCLGSALGLRCTVRSLRRGPRARKVGWLALGAMSLGCGIWTMHFVAMMGFSVDGSVVEYDTGMTVLSLLVAIAVTALGVFLVGYRGSRARVLATAGVLMGLGVAAMHYLGMAAMNVHGTVHYDSLTVALSVLIAVGAATAALWAAVSIRGLWASFGAALVMGVAVTGMHYTGMAAVSVHLGQDGAQQSGSSVELLSFLLAMTAGPVVLLIVAAAVVMFDPDLVLGEDEARPGPRLEAAPASAPLPTAAPAGYGQPLPYGHAPAEADGSRSPY
ncbi:MHYT domain-containing protein [Streptomyces coelicoflavus]|uniref:MHYT domain-containing protein n=1 Tax=Streptomyces coelicoflavus TaxID=285562 RepID=UPI00364EBBE6